MPDPNRPNPRTWLAEKTTKGEVRPLAASVGGAGPVVNRARTHLKSADTLKDTDPEMSLTASYDAVRKAITGHMADAGYRPENVPGSHKLVVEYTRIALPHVNADDFEQMRRDRNLVEYGGIGASRVTPAMAADAHAKAATIVNAVAADLAKRSGPPASGRQPKP